MKKYNRLILFVFGCMLFLSCHKKHKDPVPMSWEQVSTQGDFTVNNNQVLVYNNELVLYDKNGNVLYRYDVNGKLIERKQLFGETAQVYPGFYIEDSLQHAVTKYNNDSLTLNSYSKGGARYSLDLRSYLTDENQDYYNSRLVPTLDSTLPATLNYQAGSSQKIFLAAYEPDTSNGYVNGIKKISIIGLGSFIPYAYAKIYGFKGKYIFTEDDGTFCVSKDGSVIKANPSEFNIQLIYKDSLYAVNQDGLYSTYDGINWNFRTKNNPSVNYPISKINDRLLMAHQSGDLLEYHLESNTTTTLMSNGLGQAYGYVLLGNYVYAYGKGIFRIKYSDLFK